MWNLRQAYFIKNMERLNVNILGQTSARVLQHFERKESKSSAHEEDIFYCSYIHVILSFETTLFAFQQRAHSRNQLSNGGSGERASCGG